MDLAERADALQRPWLLPFEVVDLTPELNFFSPAVVTDDGTVHVPSAAPGPAEREAEAAGRPPGRRFAYVIAARADGEEQVLATDRWAGAAGQEHLSREAADASAWLLRVERTDDGLSTLVLRGPERLRPRQVEEGAFALLLDLGNVLTRFDRRLFKEHYWIAFGQELPQEGYRQVQELRLSFERGEIAEEEFFDRAMKPLHLAPPDRAVFATVWGSILSRKHSTIALVRRAKTRDNVAVIAVSNTDPLCLRYAREELGLEDLLYGAAASYHEGMNPKGVDASLWLKARDTATAQLGGTLRRTVAVDDVRTYLHEARNAGAADTLIHYRNMAQFKYELGAAGLYLPLQREIPVA